MATQAERRAATIGKLTAATIACLAESGARGATVSAICKRAGCSQGALFRHFASRNELLASTVHEIGAANIAGFAGFAELQPSELADSLPHVIDVLRTLARSPNHAAWREVVVAARTEPELRGAVREAVAAFEAAILELAVQFFPNAEPLHAATVLLSVLHMLDSEALTVAVVPNPEIEAARRDWAASVLRALL